MFCLSIYQKDVGTAYTLYNIRKDNSPTNYNLVLARISYTGSKMDLISVKNHYGTNNYGGAKFMHMSRFYFWGQSRKLYGKLGAQIYDYS